VRFSFFWNFFEGISPEVRLQNCLSSKTIVTNRFLNELFCSRKKIPEKALKTEPGTVSRHPKHFGSGTGALCDEEQMRNY
jgi:hypothetical protein